MFHTDDNQSDIQSSKDDTDIENNYNDNCNDNV